MAKIYETKIINTGGRAGEVHSEDKTFHYNVAAPNLNVAGATNPEQLFAAGFSACFNSALELVLSRADVKEKSTVSATVSLNSDGPSNFFLAVLLEGHVENISREDTQAFLEQAHQVCPYSKATRGNIEVTVTAV